MNLIKIQSDLGHIRNGIHELLKLKISDAGGNPSTWFPPEGLVEYIVHNNHHPQSNTKQTSKRHQRKLQRSELSTRGAPGAPEELRGASEEPQRTREKDRST